MTKQLLALCVILVGSLLVAGCGEDKNLNDDLVNSEWNSELNDENDNNTILGENGSEVGEGTNPDDIGEVKGVNTGSETYNLVDAGDGFEVCQTFTTGLEKVPSRVMILLDKSESMNDDNKWNLALSAIDSIVSEFDENIAFGLDVFSADQISSIRDYPGGGSSRGGYQNSSLCGVGNKAVLDVAEENGQRILDALERFRPGNATPLQLAMMNYLDADFASIFMDQKGSSYLVIISDGMDTCGSEGNFDLEGGATAQDLAQVANNIKEESGINSIVIGFGEGADPDQLNAIAESGGTEFTEYFDANDGDELTQALSTIAQTVVVSCQFQIEKMEGDDLNLDLVNVLLDGTPVPRDDGCVRDTGWTWANEDRTSIKFCEEACQKLKEDDAKDFSLEVACSEDDVIIVY